MNKEARETAKIFKKAIESKYHSKGKTLDDYFSSHPFIKDHSPWTERRRVKKLLQLYENKDIKELKRIMHIPPHHWFYSYFTGITWQWGRDNINIFHNEGVLNHFNGCMFTGQTQTAVFEKLMIKEGLKESPDDWYNKDWDKINTSYFKKLQSRANDVFDKSAKIRKEIVKSDNVFKAFYDITNNLWFYDPLWDLSPKKIWDLYYHYKKLYREYEFREYHLDFGHIPSKDLNKYFSEKIISLSLYYKHREKPLKLHDLISDEKIKKIYPNKDIVQPEIKFENELRKIQETTYLVKEMGRTDVKKIGKEIIDIYTAVIDILNEMKR